MQCSNVSSSLWYWHNPCLNQSQICDHYVDCQDRSDELDCSHLYNRTTQQPRVMCPSNYFPCGYLNRTYGALCVPQTKRCNGEIDCLNGADEATCDLHCPPHMVPCNNGTNTTTGLGCVRFEQRCDEVMDCSDNSDETFCSTDLR